jgi:hypothetical protein
VYFTELVIIEMQFEKGLIGRRQSNRRNGIKRRKRREGEKELGVHKLSNFNTNFNSLCNFVNMKVL